MPCTKPSAKAGGGRREREADSGTREERSSRVPIATVEGIRSSESRRPSRGGGGTRVSVGPTSRTKASSFVRPMHRRQWVSRDRREGERRQRAESESEATRTHHEDRTITRGLEDTSFARFTDPCIRFSSRKGRENGLVDIAVGKLRVIGRNRHRGQPGRTDSAARRSSSLSQERGMAGQKRKTVSAVVPARKRELRRSARTSVAVAEIGRRQPVLE